MRVKDYEEDTPGPAPETPESWKRRLLEDPKKSRRDAWFPTEQKAIDAAKRFERGERRAGGWDPEDLFASWKPGPNPKNPEEDGWWVLIGSRAGMDDDWRLYWEKFNARRFRLRSRRASS